MEAFGDYYKKNGVYLGSDGKNDHKAYVVKDEAVGQSAPDGTKILMKSGVTELQVTNSTLFKLAGVAYAESSERKDSKEEKFGIASASVNNYSATPGEQSLSEVLGKISNATFDGNERYASFMNSSGGEKNDTAKQTAVAASINAVSGGHDYSNGAAGWDGRDLSYNSHRFGLNISNPAHDLFNVGDRPLARPENGSNYRRQTPAAFGQIVFMQIHPTFVDGGGRGY